MIKTCIFGGGGFIGKYVVNRLCNDTRKLTVIGRSLVSPFGNDVNYIANTDKSREVFERIFKDQDEVIELSYSTTPQTSFEDPIKDLYENLAFSVKIYEALIKSDVKKILYVSSGGTIYGNSKYTPIDEEHPTNPVSPYGITKLAIEKYGLMYHLTSDLPIVIVRPGNAYGAGQKPNLSQRFISTAIGSILLGKTIIKFGKSGTIRDYIYVDDVAEGIKSVLEHGAIGECYNIGSGVDLSNVDILHMLNKQIEGSRFHINIDEHPERKYDVKTNILYCQKLKNLSNWTPKIDIEKCLMNTMIWMKQHLQIED